MNTVQLVLNVQLVRHLVNRRQASANLVTDALETPGHLGGVHRGVHADDFTTEGRQARYAQLVVFSIFHQLHFNITLTSL